MRKSSAGSSWLDSALLSASFAFAGLAIAAAGAAFSGHSADHVSATRQPSTESESTRGTQRVARRTISGAGYEPKLTLEQFVNFPATRYVFEGVIEKVLAPRHVRNRVFEHVYSPVVIRVTSMHIGDRPVDGTFILRAFGGIADDVEFVGDLEASEELTTVGTKVLVVSPEAVRVEGDSLAATTPLVVYKYENDALRKITYAHSARDPDSTIAVVQASDVLKRSCRSQ